MKKNKQDEYYIQAKLDLLVSISVPANSLEDALSKSKTLKEINFVKFIGDYLDGGFSITGAYKNN